jgi:hypothetical protein
VEQIQGVLERFPDLPMTPRQVYYQLVVTPGSGVENSDSSCDRVERWLVTLRETGEVDDERIVDRTRNKHQVSSWENGVEGMRALGAQLRSDPWLHQEAVVMVGLEKQALEGVFTEVVDRWGASLWVMRGFSSRSFLYEWAKSIREHNEEGRKVVIAYFGDWDPSGLALEENARSQLREHGAEFEWQRHGLLWSDFDRFHVALVPVKRDKMIDGEKKKGDSRTPRYLETFGDKAGELDALPPDELHERVTSVVTKYLDMEAWKRVLVADEAQRESIMLLANNMPAAIAAARAANG